MFTLEEIRAAAPNSYKNKVHSAGDLTLGAYKHLFGAQEAFVKLHWGLDHGLFLNAIEAVRQVRNDLMHFSADPPAADQLESIRSLLQVLRTVDPPP